MPQIACNIVEPRSPQTLRYVDKKNLNHKIGNISRSYTQFLPKVFSYRMAWKLLMSFFVGAEVLVISYSVSILKLV